MAFGCRVRVEGVELGREVLGRQSERVKGTHGARRRADALYDSPERRDLSSLNPLAREGVRGGGSFDISCAGFAEKPDAQRVRLRARERDTSTDGQEREPHE